MRAHTKGIGGVMLIALAALLLAGCSSDSGSLPDPTVNKEDADRITPLMHAAAKGDVAEATALFNRGADANVASSDSQITAMMVAAYYGQRRMVDLLGEHGATFAPKDADGNGPVDWALWGGHKDLVAFFEDKGADLKPVGGDALSSFLAAGSLNLTLMKKALGSTSTSASTSDRETGGTGPSPTESKTSAPIRVASGDQRLVKIRDAQPVYPPSAKAARVQGIVIVEATVDEQGNVSEARVTRSVQQLDQAALDAVKRWAFRPIEVNGVRVRAVAEFPVTFNVDR